MQNVLNLAYLFPKSQNVAHCFWHHICWQSQYIDCNAHVEVKQKEMIYIVKIPQ